MDNPYRGFSAILLPVFNPEFDSLIQSARMLKICQAGLPYVY